MDETQAPLRVDERGYLLSPSGTKLARVDGDRLLLYDKRSKREISFTLRDLLRMLGRKRGQHE